MKKLKNKAGFTLIELLVSLAIMVILVMGIGTGMDAGARVYKESVFQSDSSSLEGILNTTLGDLLRYSEGIITKEEDPSIPGDFVFTSFDFGVKDAYFVVDHGAVKLQSRLSGSKTADLINNGAYPDLKLQNFKVTYVPSRGASSHDGSYFVITYTIQSKQNAHLSRDVEYVVRMMNPPAETTAPTDPTTP